MPVLVELSCLHKLNTLHINVFTGKYFSESRKNKTTYMLDLFLEYETNNIKGLNDELTKKLVSGG